MQETFSVRSQEGNERLVADRVTEIVSRLGLGPALVERLQTAVSEATMNAIEHGNLSRPELTVDIEVVATSDAVTVRVTDHGGGRGIPDPQAPDLEAKLAGEQTPRGWGLFLIERMVDELRTTSDDRHHTVEMVVYPEARR